MAYKDRIYKELPDWRACRIDISLWRNPKSKYFPSYDIFVLKHIEPNDSNYVFYKNEKSYVYVGSLGTDGYLRAASLGSENKFFGTKLKQAVRYLYLKTLKSK